MKSIQNLYHQGSNREYLENTYGREIWVQVSGHRELNKADAGFWAALIPLDQVDDVFRDVGWDSSVGTQAPCFVSDGLGSSYQRLQPDFNPCENIVHYRDFYGIKPDYVELVEEFRLLNNLYHDSLSDTYYAILDNIHLCGILQNLDLTWRRTGLYNNRVPLRGGIGSCTLALVGWCKGLFLCFDRLNLRQAEPACFPGAALGGGISDGGLIQSLGAVGVFVAQPLPVAPGVGFLVDPGSILGGIAGLGIGPGHPQSLGETLHTLAEELPCRSHDGAEIVLFHIVVLL